MANRMTRQRLMAAAMGMTCVGVFARYAAADITNVSRAGTASAVGQAQAFDPKTGMLLDSGMYSDPKSDQTGTGPVNLNANGSVTSVQGASASSSANVNGTITLDPDTGGMVVSSNGAANANAIQSSTSTRITLARASSNSNFNFQFTLTKQNYDYRIDLGNVSVRAPVGADTTASVFLGGQTFGFRENVSSDEPTTMSGSLTGTLAPGTYGMSGSVDASGGNGLGNASSSFGFTLTLTPSAPEFHWTNTGGGAFGTDSNWDPKHVPGASDAAVFDKPGSYTVQLDQDVQNQKVRFNGSGVNVNIDLAGHTYTANELDVGGLSGDNVRVGFTDSGIVVARPSRGRNAPEPITLSVASNMNVRGGGEVDVALPTSSGTLNIDGGGLVTASGVNAQWLAQSLLMGSTGAANLTLSNKATLTTPFANIGVGVSGNATVTVSDNGTAWTADNIIVGGLGTGSLSVLRDSQVFAKQMVAGIQVGSTGTITVDSGNSLQTRGSLLGDSDSTGSLLIGGQGTGHLIVKGIGVVQMASLDVGSRAGGNGDVTITDPSSIVHAESLKVGTLGIGSVSVSHGGILATSESRVGTSVIGTNGTVSLASNAIWHANTTLEVDGTLQVDSSSSVAVGSGFSSAGILTVLPGGILSGTGTIAVGKVVLAGGTNAFSGGTVKPGHSPGTLTIQGGFEQQPGGVLEIEVTGTGANQFDVLNVTGTATLAGDLLLKFEDGFTPKQGDTFAFLNAATMSGSFANVKLHDLATGFQFSLNPAAGGISLVALNDAISSRIPGDANDDGKVDFADLLVLAQNYNRAGTFSTGDFDKSGTVGFPDLLILVQHFGQSATEVVTVPVPEPSVIAAAVLPGALLRRRQRHQTRPGITPA